MSDTARDPDETVAMLPVQLQLRGRRCVVVGGGAVAARRSRSLLDAGAVLTVVAPVVDPSIDALADSGALQVRRHEFRSDDLEPDGTDRVVLVVTATDDPLVNEAAAAAAARYGTLVNRADDSSKGDLSFPATIRRGPVTIAVSTRDRTSGPAAPVASRWVADRLDSALDSVLGLDAVGLDSLVRVLSDVRRELRDRSRAGDGPVATDERGVTVGAVDWRSALDGSILDLIHQGRTAEAKERLLACLSS